MHVIIKQTLSPNMHSLKFLQQTMRHTFIGSHVGHITQQVLHLDICCNSCSVDVIIANVQLHNLQPLETPHGGNVQMKILGKASWGLAPIKQLDCIKTMETLTSCFIINRTIPLLPSFNQEVPIIIQTMLNSQIAFILGGLCPN